MFALRTLRVAAIAAVLPSLVGATVPDDGIHKIAHVVIIMQENRSFDSYFGTFPGADGFPMKAGVPAVCVPDPATGACVRPYHDTGDENIGGPHSAAAADRDINDGAMDGFIRVMRGAKATGGCPTDIPTCIVRGRETTVMGYHTERELPNYWAYARAFVLQDHMFEPVRSWSLPAHLFMVSEWAASCAVIGDPMSCRPERAYFHLADLPRDLFHPDAQAPGRPSYAWTDLTYLLHAHHVSWAYYVMDGSEPDCDNDQSSCNLKPHRAHARYLESAPLVYRRPAKRRAR
jgi:phospholipase C